MRRQAAFLDRDGVLVDALVREGRAFAPTALVDFRLVPDAERQIRRLKAAGLVCCVVTNQPELAHGLLDWPTLDAMHLMLRDALPVDDILVCPHVPGDGCACRKPLPGLLRQAAATWRIDLSASVIVGDRWSDVAAGRAVGCRTVLLDRPYSARSTSDSLERARTECAAADARVATLGAAVDAALDLARASTEQGD